MRRHAFKKTYEILLAALATDVEGAYPLLVCPFAGIVDSVEYIPVAAITGANTNTRKVEVINKGTAGAGTAVVAELQFNTGVNAAAFDSKAIALSATPANLEVAEGAVLAWSSTAPGTGIADPGGMVRITISRDVSES